MPVTRWPLLAAALFVTIASGGAGAPGVHAGARAPLRVLVYHDMEGLSGQDDPTTCLFSHPDRYPIGQKLLIADVNAVVAGLFAGGATAVDVVDAHGSGNPDPDLPLDALDKRAGRVWRDHPFEPYLDITEANKYEAVAVVGMHSKAGSGGFMAHTITPGLNVILEDSTITETEIVAYSWGSVGVPVIFASGDDRLRGDLRRMPWIEYVTTKTATSASTAKLRPVDDVHAEMRASAARAVHELGRMKAMTLHAPIHGALRATPPANLAALAQVPGVAYSNQTVRFTANNFAELFRGWNAIGSIASAAWRTQSLRASMGGRPEAKAISAGAFDTVLTRWLTVESGKPMPPWSPPPAPRRYYGDF